MSNRSFVLSIFPERFSRDVGLSSQFELRPLHSVDSLQDPPNTKDRPVLKIVSQIHYITMNAAATAQNVSDSDVCVYSRMHRILYTMVVLLRGRARQQSHREACVMLRELHVYRTLYIPECTRSSAGKQLYSDSTILLASSSFSFSSGC